MGKCTQKNLVGQPIFKQILNLLPKNKFDLLVKRHKTLNMANVKLSVGNFFKKNCVLFLYKFWKKFLFVCV